MGSTGTMRALRFHAAKDLRVDELEIPSVKPGFVRIKPAFCGICGSDLHEYEDGPHIIPQKGSPYILTGETLPLTMGHEFSGVVDKVGEGVTHVKPGDKVCVQPTIYDGDCRSCTLGLNNCCDKFGFIGLSGWGGGMAEYTSCPAAAVKKLADNVPLNIGALVEPLAVGWHAVKTSPFKPGDSVLVLGGGPIGLAVVLALQAQGCDNIIVSEVCANSTELAIHTDWIGQVSSRRRQFAQEFGAHHVVDPTKSDIVEEVKKLTKGLGADVAFDAAGVQIAVDTAIKAIRARGTLVNIALWGNKRVTLDMMDMLFGERRYMAGERSLSLV